MSRTYNVFGDIEGKLTMLRVECTRFEGRLSQSNHPRMRERCDLICPDLPKVL
jgi:hypothetical protein